MKDKEFKSIDELINILISRGVNISSSYQRAFVKTSLQKNGYYNVINGYKKLFLDPVKTQENNEDYYKTGTTYEEIYALYDFDKNIRMLFLEYILQVEINIKALIAYIFPQKYSSDNYLLYKNFDTNKKDSYKKITDLISEIQRLISNRSNDPSINHYLINYGYIPLWVLNNILTLGIISKFYSLMKQPERQYLSKKFKMSDSELESALFYLTKVRNFCAHDNRLYCFRNSTQYIDTKHHIKLNIQHKANGEYMYGKRDMFATLIILNDLLSKNEYKKLLKRLNKLLNNFTNKLNVLSEQDILSSLVFPSK